MHCACDGPLRQAVHRHSKQVMVLKELQRFDQQSRVSFLKEVVSATVAGPLYSIGRQVSMLKALSHPNVLQFIGVLYRDTKMLLITEFLEGGCFSTLIVDVARAFAWSQRVRSVRDIADGMVGARVDGPLLTRHAEVSALEAHHPPRPDLQQLPAARRRHCRCGRWHALL